MSAEGTSTELQFQEFGTDVATGPAATAGTDTGDLSLLLPAPTGQGDHTPPAPSISSLEYYQQFFDVDTEQVLSRIRASIWPWRDDFLHRIKNRSDLYGPFWISTTLIFVLAMAGNIVEWKSLPVTEKDTWRYDFTKITFAASTIYTYVTLMPFLVWAYIRWRIATGPTFLEVLCVYGYSMFIYIPVAIACMMNQSAMAHLVLILAALSLSGGVLVTTFLRAIGGDKFGNRGLLLGIIATAHCALALVAPCTESILSISSCIICC